MKYFLGKFSELSPGRTRIYLAGGKKIFVMNHEGKPKAWLNFCPHMGGALRADGRRVKCMWHGATFDAVSGMAVDGPAEGSGLTAVRVDLEGEDLYFVPDTEVKKSPWADDF